MSGQINHYKLTPIERWATPVTQLRHLTHYFGTSQSQELDNIFVHLFAYNEQPTLESFIKEHTTVKEFDDDREIKWKVYGTVAENVPLYEARNESGAVVNAGDANVGVGGTRFQLVFEKPMFYKGEMIVGMLNEMYQFRIVDEPITEGNMAVYNVELMYGAATGVPAERLLYGEPFSVDFAPVEKEGSRGVGGIRYQNFTWMHNEWTTIRKRNKLFGNMKDRKFDNILKERMVTSIPTRSRSGNGFTVEDKTLWVYNEEVIMNREWRQEKANVIAYSRSNRNSNGTYFNHGDSGNVITEGDGLFAQMDYGNTADYNTFGDNFNMKLMINKLLDLYESSNTPIDQRHVVCTTGSRGMMQVNSAINKDTMGCKFTINADAIGAVKRVDNPANQNALSYGYQFTQLVLPNGMVIDFRLDPSQDTRKRNKIEGPNGNGVMESYIYNFFDIGNRQESNVYLCKLKGEEDTIRYIPGMRNPFTGENFGRLAVTDEDATQVEYMTTTGVCVVDPTRTMRIIPSQLIA